MVLILQVIVGSVDGNRLWGKELKNRLAFVEWSPDGRSIIFVTLEGEVSTAGQTCARRRFDRCESYWKYI